MTPRAEMLNDGSGFSWKRASVLAEASRLVYETSEAVEGELRRWSFTSPQFLAQERTELAIASHDDHRMVVFRGTKGAGDWLGNFEIGLVSRPYGDVHGGFVRAYEDVHKNVIQGLHGADHVWLAGHSLGGALASIAAASLKSEGIDIAGIYTFGQPMTGASSFKATIDSGLPTSFFRFVNHKDIVTRIPPGSAWRHVGRLVHFASNGSLLAAPPGISVVVEGAPSLQAQPDTEAAPLTEKEVRERSQEIELTLELATTPVGGPAEDALPEGVLSDAQDHSMDEYIRKIAGQLSS